MERRRAPAVLHRHPGDVARLVVAVAGLLVLTAVATGGRLSRSEIDALRLCNDLPRLLTPLAFVALAAGSMVVLAAGAALAVLIRRDRLAADLVVVAGVSYGSAVLIRHLVRRAALGGFAPALGHVHHLQLAWVATWSGGFPSAAMAVAAGYATAAGPYQSRHLNRLAWGAVAGIGVARLYAGVDLPVDVVGGAFLGWAAGAAVNLVAGTPLRRARPEQVCAALRRLMIDVGDLEPAGRDRAGRSVFVGQAPDGSGLVAYVIDREERSADLLFRLWRRVAYRHAHEELSFASGKRRCEHEALVATMAAHQGVRTPEVLAAGAALGLVVLVERDVRGTLLADLPSPEAALPGVWAEVAVLRSRRIAHGELRPDRIVVDGEGRPWVRGFAFGETGASDHLLALDVAHLLVTTADLVGPKPAALAAIDALGPAVVVDAVPLLQRLALPYRNQREWRRQGRLIVELRTSIAELTGAPGGPPLQLTRLHPRTMLSLAAAGLAVYFLLPQVGHLDQTLTAVSRANWWWLLLSFVPTAATYAAAAIAQMGAVNQPIPLAPMTAVQVACAFTNRVTPAGTGGLGLNERFLEKEGVTRSAAIGAVSLNVLAGAIVHFLATMLAIAVLGSAGIGGVKVPPGWWFLVAALVVLAIGGVVFLSPIRHRVTAPLARAARDLAGVVRRPAQALRLFGGSAGVTMGYALALAAALACFGVHAPLDRVVVVYLGGSAVASVSPTPGALGAVEAALLAGLTGIGIAPGPALAGVLAFRVVTFWLPTLPGLWAFHHVQRKRWV